MHAGLLIALLTKHLYADFRRRCWLEIFAAVGTDRKEAILSYYPLERLIRLFILIPVTLQSNND